MSPFAIIIVIDIYIGVLLFFAAVKVQCPLPHLPSALFMVPALFLVLVMSFAELYAANGTIQRMKLDNRIEKIGPQSDRWDATYFSLVTITTLGYGDFVPQETSGRKIVIGELLSGVLLLLFAIPVVGSRLASFDEPEAKTVLKIEKLADTSWTVQKDGVSSTPYPVSKSLTVTVERIIEIKHTE